MSQRLYIDHWIKKGKKHKNYLLFLLLLFIVSALSLHYG